MKPKTKIVISASRRTDIPAFYMDWFMEQIKQGKFKVKNPFNQKEYIVSALPSDVHTIVFWSKNFGPFIKKKYYNELIKIGYNLFFNFTINSFSPLLEPNIPPLKNRLEQLNFLADYFKPKSINWRFDPICFYETNNKIYDNLKDFETIAEKASEYGIKRCITSFMDNY